MDIRLTAKNRWLVVPALAILTLAVYGAALHERPFDRQEALLASRSQALLASGGRDADGRLLPLFLHAGGDEWLAPGQAYMAATAELLLSSGLSPVRWITVLAGVLDVALMFVLATRIFSSTALGTMAALLLLFTPAHAQFSRSAGPDGVWPLPFLMAWLLGLVVFSDLSSPFRRQALAIGAFALAALAYAQPSSALMVPLFATLSLVALYKLYRAGQWQWPDVRPACVAFVMTLAPLALWFVMHQSAYPDTFGRWLVHLAHVRQPLDGLRAATRGLTVASVSATYWDYFSPAYLFINGNAVGFAGVFLVPVAGLLIAGGWTIARSGAKQWMVRPVDFLVLGGFLCAPLVAATFKEPRVTGRALVIVPFGVLLATRGLEVIRSRPGAWRRILIALLLVVAACQFLFWYRQLV